jgi:rRNA maturation RNase YbeY
MIKVDIYKQTNYPVPTRRIKEIVKKTLESNGLTSDFEVSLAIVGDRKMQEITRSYYKGGSEEHPVFTFVSNETKMPFVFPPGGGNGLGEIVISFPQAVKKANESGRLVGDIVCDLAEHGALHLLGIHH